MADVRLTDDELVIELGRGEKIGGLVGDQRIEVDSITNVEVFSEALAAPNGIRAPGLGIPFRTKVGTWRSLHGREFVCVYHHTPALRIEVDAPGFHAYCVSTPNALDLAADIARRQGE